MESIMERLEKIETKQDEANEGIHEIKNRLTSMCGAFVHRDEFDELKKEHEGIRTELTSAKGFISGVKAVAWFLGLSTVGGVVALLKLVFKVF